MNKLTPALLAFAALSSTSLAVDNTRVDWQVSRDNVVWSSDLNISQGQEVWVRVLFTYTGPQPAVGLASVQFQPIVSNWDLAAKGHTADQATVFTPGEVTDPTNALQFGRVRPFFANPLSPAHQLTGFVHTNQSGGAPPGNWLRIAEAQATSWLSGGGVPIAQLSNVGRTTSDPAFSAVTSQVLVYKFGIFLSNERAARTLVIDSPDAGFGNLNTNTGGREVYWYASMNEATGSIRGTPAIFPATIHVQPCGSADFNGDGDSGTDADIEAFFACIAGDCCASCGSADFNGDGDTATDADIEAFFRVLAGGTC